MMNYIFSFIILISVGFGLFAGTSQDITNAFLNESVEAINLFLIILGGLCFWGGIMEIAEKSHLTDKISKIISPFIDRLFINLKNNKKAKEAISMNISANLLGLGNAAIPFGIVAMEEIKKGSLDKNIASNDMIMMIILNSASIQLIPSNIAMLRLNAGSNNPFDIILAVWIVSILSLISGIISVKIFSYFTQKKRSIIIN